MKKRCLERVKTETAQLTYHTDTPYTLSPGPQSHPLSGRAG